MGVFMKDLIRRYQILIFLALTFIISWYPWYTGGVGFKAAGPSYAGLIVVAMVSGWTGIKEVLRRLILWRVSPIWWIVAVLGPVAITLTAISLHVLAGGEAPNFLIWRQEPHMVLVLMLILISPVGGAGGEEPFGWRGYAQPRLQEKWGRWGPLLASLIIGIVWAVWHLPEFTNPASTQYALGWSGFVPLIITEIANSIIMTWLYINTGGSVLVAGVIWHLAIDTFGSTMLLDFTVSGMLAGDSAPPADMALITMQTAVMAVVAFVLIVATRGWLGFEHHKQDDPSKP
jgi:membrane protease YdiL (CAAX protease family)